MTWSALTRTPSMSESCAARTVSEVPPPFVKNTRGDVFSRVLRSCSICMASSPAGRTCTCAHVSVVGTVAVWRTWQMKRLSGLQVRSSVALLTPAGDGAPLCRASRRHRCQRRSGAGRSMRRCRGCGRGARRVPCLHRAPAIRTLLAAGIDRAVEQCSYGRIAVVRSRAG